MLYSFLMNKYSLFRLKPVNILIDDRLHSNYLTFSFLNNRKKYDIKMYQKFNHNQNPKKRKKNIFCTIENKFNYYKL